MKLTLELLGMNAKQLLEQKPDDKHFPKETKDRLLLAYAAASNEILQKNPQSPVIKASTYWKHVCLITKQFAYIMYRPYADICKNCRHQIA